MSFVHLHLHSQYSMLDGFLEFDRLLARAQQLNMSALALTDHGNMFGALEFYKKAMKVGIKPILGCEVYVASGSRLEHSREGGGRNHHMVLLARNRSGYENLCTLVSRANFEGFYYKPRVDFELLQKYGEGLIATSACLRGEIPHLLLSGMGEEAEKRARQYQTIFGAENFYLELQDHGLAEQHKLNAMLVDLGQRISAPLVATNDCHYLNREDAHVHDVLLCIQTGRTVDETERMKFHNDQFYLKTEEEMQQRFAAYPEALSNTLEVANKIHMNFEFGKYLFPSFAIPSGRTIDDYLADLTKTGFEKRSGSRFSFFYSTHISLL